MALEDNAGRQRHDDRRRSRTTGSAPRSGTTSLETSPTSSRRRPRPRVYDTNDAAIAALKAKQIDAHRRRPADGVLHDRRPARRRRHRRPVRRPGADAEHFSVVLTKGSPLTACVNEAIDALDRRRHARRDHARSGSPTRRRPRSSSPSRSRRPPQDRRRPRDIGPLGRLRRASVAPRGDRAQLLAVDRDRARQHGRRLRRSSPGSSSTRRAGRRSSSRSSTREVFWDVAARAWSARSWINVQLFLIAEVLILAVRPAAGGHAQPARARSSSRSGSWRRSTSTSSGRCRAS